MPMLKNQKHELFAQAIARGESGRIAYRSAGFSGTDAACDAHACRLAKSGKVEARIAELRDRQGTAQATVLTKAWVIEQTIGLKRKAEESGSYGPAVRCMELLGREVNAFVEKKEIGLPGEFADLKDAELVDIVRHAIPGGSGTRGTRGKGAGPAANKETMQ